MPTSDKHAYQPHKHACIRAITDQRHSWTEQARRPRGKQRPVILLNYTWTCVATPGAHTRSRKKTHLADIDLLIAHRAALLCLQDAQELLRAAGELALRALGPVHHAHALACKRPEWAGQGAKRLSAQHDTPARQSSHQSVSQPISQSASWPAGPSISLPVYLPTSQSDSLPASWPVSQPISWPAIQSCS